MARLQGHGVQQAGAYRRVVEALAVPAVFLRLAVGGNAVALAYGALHGGLVCCDSVITAPPYRGQGCARRLMQALFHWAGANSAQGACLQVVEDNDPAKALYASLGMTTELYRYHYRRAPR